MPRGKQSKGNCVACGAEILKNGVAKHLGACPARRTLVLASDQNKGKPEKIWHLRVQSADADEFWIDLEMRSSATLKKLDDYLRAIWLECCGHLSEFSLGGWGSAKVGMGRKAGDVFKPGVKLTHIYDFGTSSTTLIKVVGSREGRPLTQHPIALLVRNQMPETECLKCKQPSRWLCMECMIDENMWGTLCNTHVKTHPHKDYEPVRLVNSPRLGLCGYDGPAEPPY